MSSTQRGRRPRDAAPPTDEQLIAWFEAGELLGRITRYLDLRDPDQFQAAARQAGALTAAGEMDLLSFIESGAVAELERHAFFVLMQFYVHAIPAMVEPVPRMLAAVDALVRIGGTDGAATWPYDALLDWLRNDPPRAEQIIAGAGAGDAHAAANLAFGLQVVADPERARAFLASPNPQLKASALTALARIPDGDPASRATSIKAIESALGEGSDDTLGANGIAAILAIASHEPFVDDGLVLSATSLALGARGDGTLYAATVALWTNTRARRPEIVPAILKGLLDLNPEHKGTTDLLDLVLKALIDAGQDEAVLQFLAELLIKDRGQLKAGAFNSVWGAIVSGPPDRLTRWISTWLLAGEIALGSAVSDVLAHIERDATGLTLDRAQLPATAADLGYLARKAVGWFMLQPHLATSLLVAILGVCDTSTARDVAGLLAHPILRNYPEMRETLGALSEDDPAKPFVDAALKENERYLIALGAVPEIPELTPSDHNRRIQYLHHADQMQAAQKAAQAQSVFSNLVHRSTLLYGVRFLSYVEDIDGGPRRPMERELGTHGVTVTLPRLDTLDPIGLQLLLFRFRGEARPQ